MQTYFPLFPGEIYHVYE